MFFFYFRYKLYSGLQKIPCELLEFSLSTRILLGSCLFQFFKDLVRTHPACQQLLQHSLCLGLLSFFSCFSICLGLLRFQRSQLFFSFLQSRLLLFQCVLLLFNRFLDTSDVLTVRTVLRTQLLITPELLDLLLQIFGITAFKQLTGLANLNQLRDVRLRSAIRI